MITVQEFAPSPVLQDYVRFYQYSETRLGTATLFRPLPARPEQLLQFSLRERYVVIDRRFGIRSKAPPIVILGRQTQRKIDLLATGDVVTFTIHFQPTGFYRLFHIALHELTNLTPDAVDVVGHEVSVLHEQLYQADSLQAMVCRAETFLMQKMTRSQPFHPVQAAAASILNRHGQVNLAELASASNVSLRQFERTFTEQVGVPPKMFSRLVRFKHALELKHRERYRSWTDIAYEAGYCDQMHLIHDCKAFADETPSALFQTWVPCRE
jgi:AraC-like DNA-binding protein